MPQQVTISHSNACLGIDDGVGARRPAWRHRVRNCVLSVDEGIEVDVAKAISKLVSNGLEVLLLLQSSSGAVLGALGGFSGITSARVGDMALVVAPP